MNDCVESVAQPVKCALVLQMTSDGASLSKHEFSGSVFYFNAY